MPRRSKEWYEERGLPLPSYITEGVKNYNWYVQRGLTPPAHLKQPKVIKDTVGNVVLFDTGIDNVNGPKLEQPVKQETDEEVEKRIKDRFEVFDTLVDDVIEGSIRGLVVSGPPGMGKSFPIERKLMAVENGRIVKGHSSAKGLYELLYEHSEEGDVVVMDDADSIFTDERALNLLKAALDTTETRVLSWLTSGPFGQSGEDVEGVPQSYVFKGSIIFITNLDFDGMIAKGNRIAKHLEAIVSRSMYIDLMMKSRRDCFVRIKQVVRETEMLMFLNNEQRDDTLKFIEDNITMLREVSLRTALKVGSLRRSNKNWMEVAKITCCKVGG